MSSLLLLHGALGATDLLTPLQQALSTHYQVYTFNFSGHGGSLLPYNGLSINLFTEELRDFIETNNLQGTPVFGYSMGGYVAMTLIQKHPHLIGKLVTLATKFHWDIPTADRECALLQADKIETKLPAFAQTLANRHAPTDWKTLMQATADMLRNMGNQPPLKAEDYPNITVPTLLLLGDRDKMVSLEETVAVYRALPQASLGLLPATAHALEQVDPTLLSFLIHRFISG